MQTLQQLWHRISGLNMLELIGIILLFWIGSRLGNIYDCLYDIAQLLGEEVRKHDPLADIEDADAQRVRLGRR